MDEIEISLFNKISKNKVTLYGGKRFSKIIQLKPEKIMKKRRFMNFQEFVYVCSWYLRWAELGEVNFEMLSSNYILFVNIFEQAID